MTRRRWYGYIALGVSVLFLCGAVTAAYTHNTPPPHQLAELPVDITHGPEAENVFQQAAVAKAVPAHAVRVPIFIYHSIRPDYPGESANIKAFTLTPEQLDEQLAYLAHNGYTTISLDDLARDIAAGTTTPVKKPVVLTFDDGWQNEYVYAFPLLTKYHLTATFFVFTNPINNKNPHYMTWDELRQMHTAGMTIGDHTVFHPYLSSLTPEQLRTEVLDAKATIEKEIGVPVTDFASPFGYSDEALTTLLKQSGFVTGRTTYKGVWHSADDQYALTGYLVHRDLKDFVYILTQAK